MLIRPPDISLQPTCWRAESAGCLTCKDARQSVGRCPSRRAAELDAMGRLEAFQGSTPLPRPRVSGIVNRTFDRLGMAIASLTFSPRWI
jgi:hypothetical protein